MRAITVCLLAALVGALGASAVDLKGSYIIKSRHMGSAAEAVTLLRRFMSGRLTAEERCQRYAVLVHHLQQSQLDQMQVADLGLAPIERVSRQYKQLDIESLRGLYMSAVQSFNENPSGLDKSLVELVECLSNKFKATDAKARSFLNNQQLQASIQQFKQIMEQPLSFLTEPYSVHPSITREQLTPNIVRTVDRLFAGDELAAMNHFSSAARQPPMAPRQEPVAVAVAVAHAGAGQQQPRPRGRAPQTLRPEPEQIRAQPAPVPVQAPQQRRASRPDPVEVAAPVQRAPVEAPRPLQQQKHQVQPQAHSQPQQQHHQQQPAQHVDSAPPSLSPEEQQYLANQARLIGDLYFRIPDQAQLGDRCRAYARVMEASPAELTNQLLEQVLAGVQTDMTKHAGADVPYQPEQMNKLNFLMVVSEIHDPAGPQLLDLIDCLAVWQNEEPDVKAFLDSPELTKSLQKLLQHSDPAAQPQQ